MPWVYVQEGRSGLPEARVAGSRHIASDSWRPALRRDPCCYCGEPVAPPLPDGDRKDDPLRWRRGSVEHLVPRRELGFGIGLDENTVGACTGCNVVRGDLGVLEMLIRTRGIGLEEERRAA